MSTHHYTLHEHLFSPTSCLRCDAPNLCDEGERLKDAPLNHVVETADGFQLVPIGSAVNPEFCDKCEDKEANELVDVRGVDTPFCVKCKAERDELVELLAREREEREPRRHYPPFRNFNCARER